MWPRNQWSLTQTVPPVLEPITVEDLKLHSRVYINDEDQVVLAYIRSARTWCETYLQKQILPATYALRLDQFPSWTLKLPMPPITAITSITYLDTQGVQQTLSSSLYVADIHSSPGRVTPAYSQIWPITRMQINAVTITYTAGYADAASVPATIKQAIRLLTTHCYEHRSDTEEVKLASIPMGVTALLDSERCVDFSGPLGSSNNIPGSVTAWGPGNFV